MKEIKWRLSGAFVAIAFLALAFGLDSPALADPGGGGTTLVENSLLIPAPPPPAKIVPAISAFNVVSPPTAWAVDNSNANINSNVSPQTTANVINKDVDSNKAAFALPGATPANVNVTARNGPTFGSIVFDSFSLDYAQANERGICSGTELATAGPNNLGANNSG